jgi:phage-related protein
MLLAVALLAAIKFGLMPVLQWQEDKLLQIAAVEKRNLKSQKLMESKEQLFMQMVQTGNSYKKLAEALPIYQDQASYRLQTQVMVEQILKMDNLNTKRFFWRTELDKKLFGNLHSSSFNVNFSGKAKDLVMLHTKLATNYPEFRVLNMSNQLSKYSEKSLGRVIATLTVEAYYWRGGIN